MKTRTSAWEEELKGLKARLTPEVLEKAMAFIDAKVELDDHEVRVSDWNRQGQNLVEVEFCDENTGVRCWADMRDARKPKFDGRKRRAILDQIAKEELFLETLSTRKSDQLDFSDQAVWNIKKALELAFEAGRNSR